MVDIERQPHEQAERGLASVQAGADKELAADLGEVSAPLGITDLNDKQPAKARAVFERAVQQRPQSARAQYGLGRVLTDAGNFDAAIAAFERAAALDGAAQMPIDYRLALACQGKGKGKRERERERDKARALPTRFVAAGNGGSKNLDDARKRLAEAA